jgi:hypothetical protein
VTSQNPGPSAAPAAPAANAANAAAASRAPKLRDFLRIMVK